MKIDRTEQAAGKQGSVKWRISYSPKQTNEHLNVTAQAQPVELRARNMLPTFSFSRELASQLQTYVVKGNERCGVMMGTTFGSKPLSSMCLELMNPILSVEEDDIHTKICEEKCFCTSFLISRVVSKRSLEKFEYEMRRCLQTLEYSSDEDIPLEQHINELQKIYLQLTRAFFCISLSNQQFERVIFFPNVNLLLQKVMFKSKYVGNEILSSLLGRDSSSLAAVPTFGYLIPDHTNRITVVERSFVNIADPPPLMGVWMYAADIKKKGAKDSHELNPENLPLVWALITDYIRREKLEKVSFIGPNRGLFILFTPGDTKPREYMFECKQEATSNRWAFAKSSSSKFQLGGEIIFDILVLEESLQDLFGREEKEQPSLRKQVSSPIKKEVSEAAPKREFVNFSNNSFARSEADSRSVKEISDRVSQKSYDERDVQIEVLKQTLEFYKKKCEQLTSKNQELERELLRRSQQQFVPFFNPMMQHPMAMPMPGPIGIPPSPMAGYHQNGMSPGFFPPFYHSNVVVPQSFGQHERLNGSNGGNLGEPAMYQNSRVFSREDCTAEQKIQEDYIDNAFAKKQYTVEPTKQAAPISSPYTTPIHRLANTGGILKSDLKINLADQFSEGSPKVNESTNSLAKPVKCETKDEGSRDSPKFQLVSSEQLKEKDTEEFEVLPMEEPKPNTFEMSFKGYAMEQNSANAPLPSSIPSAQSIEVISKLPQKSSKLTQIQSTPAILNAAETNRRFMQSFSSDNDRTIGSAFFEAVNRQGRGRVIDSDDEDDDMKNIYSRYQRRD